jgi:hypothetical protein
MAIWDTSSVIHGQEFNSFGRNTRSKAVHEFQLQRQEKFLYICEHVAPVAVGYAGLVVSG